MSELLDVLDGHGILTGRTAPRAEVHEKGLWHGTVHVYVYRLVSESVEILAHLRSALKDLYPNTWDPVLGGHIPAGYTPIQAVIEELGGEAGLAVSSDDLVVGPIVKADKGPDKEFNHLFLYRFPEGTSLSFPDGEVQAVRWVGLADVLEAIRTSPSEWRPTHTEFSVAYSVVTSLLKK